MKDALNLSFYFMRFIGLVSLAFMIDFLRIDFSMLSFNILVVFACASLASICLYTPKKTLKEAFFNGDYE